MHKQNIIDDMTCYYYNIYGLHVKSNTLIEMVQVDICANDVDVTVELTYVNELNYDRIEIISIDGKSYNFVIPGIALYFIQANKIKCLTKDYNGFMSTLFNIPFSILFLLRGELLIHACALVTAKGLILLAGDKGVGKSTLSAILSAQPGYEFFADDTVRIDNNLIGYNAHNCTKLFPSTASKLGLKGNGNVNLAGKLYIECETKILNDNCKRLCSIIVLSRGKKLSIKKHEIKGFFLRRSIVGIEFMPLV